VTGQHALLPRDPRPAPARMLDQPGNGE
jgi:hypothetical protein